MNEELSRKIEIMATEDQKVRHAFLKDGKLIKKVKSVDKRNLLLMKEIINVYGWPTISLVGERVSNLAWLLVQHADSDISFQKKCLSLMKRYLKKNEVIKSNVAYLTDRVRVSEGRKQIYGTQFYTNPNNNLQPRPIWDIKSINKRRSRIGLEPFSIYKRSVKKMYN